MGAEMSLWGLVLQASWVVQAVMLMLLFASVASWFVIFAKRRSISETVDTSEWFEDQFWSGGNLSYVHQGVSSEGEQDEGMPGIFMAGYDELTRLQQQGKARVDETVAAVQRSMRVALSRELERLEGGLPFLATVGSTSPYVGLFGTVWGIMNAFIALGNVKQATLSMVAPGIAEALIATAMGLFAAIPAVVAYNFFTSKVDNLESRYRAFMEEFAGIVERGLRHGDAGGITSGAS